MIELDYNDDDENAKEHDSKEHGAKDIQTDSVNFRLIPGRDIC